MVGFKEMLDVSFSEMSMWHQEKDGTPSLFTGAGVRGICIYHGEWKVFCAARVSMNEHK